MAYKVKLGTFKLSNLPPEAPAQKVGSHLIQLVEATPVDPKNPQQGFDFKEIRARGKVCDAIEAAGDNDFVVLEDAHYEKLKAIIEVVPFGTANRGLLTLIDNVLEAEKVA